jgi:hypothetical protein
MKADGLHHFLIFLPETADDILSFEGKSEFTGMMDGQVLTRSSIGYQ